MGQNSEINGIESWKPDEVSEDSNIAEVNEDRKLNFTKVNGMEYWTLLN